MDAVRLGVVSVVSNEVPAPYSPSVVRAERGENSNEVVDRGDEPQVIEDSGDDDSITDEFEFCSGASCHSKLALWGESANTESNRPVGARSGGLVGIGDSGTAPPIGGGGGDGARLA
jgi:hypothetical protein